jgi:hypothetical protein
VSAIDSTRDLSLGRPGAPSGDTPVKVVNLWYLFTFAAAASAVVRQRQEAAASEPDPSLVP